MSNLPMLAVKHQRVRHGLNAEQERTTLLRSTVKADGQIMVTLYFSLLTGPHTHPEFSVLGPSDVPFSKTYPNPKALTETDMLAIEDAFVASVERCKAVGCRFEFFLT